LAYENITRSNCGACHSQVDFATGANHPGGIQTDDSQCGVCHKPTGLGGDPMLVHQPAAKTEDTPEYNVSIAMTPPANGQYYVAGEAPVVTVTLTDTATGTPVDGTVYTADADAVGASGGGLSTGALYVYGPRSDAVPVLTTNSTTDPALPSGTAPTQAHSLLLTSGASTDPLVTTSTSGFSYQLEAIPADMTPGTYMVKFYAADYGAVSATDFRTWSDGLINFQVGTATVEHKVSGDACTNCHGDTQMHVEGAHPHNAPFNTDHCLACHDKSGNYGDYIGNRVHAVHRGSITGDIKGHDWSAVTFPQPANNCTICHTNKEGTPVWRTPDAVVCGGCHGTNPTADPTSATYANDDPARLQQEIAAAQHMQQNGGDFDPTTPPTQQCTVCHGAGRIADLYQTHQLIKFGANATQGATP
jgi:hypothetical protein